MAYAAHRTIVVVDVERFGDPSRTNRHQLAVRAGLYEVLRAALAHSGVRWDECESNDLGDGILALVPPEVPKALLVERLPAVLVRLLDAHNASHRPEERIRLRLALHAGEVHHDDHGVSGRAVVHAFRLGEVPVLKAALAASPGVLAIIVSAWFYDEVVRHLDVGEFREVVVRVKETETAAWICLPGAPPGLPVVEPMGGQDVPHQLPALTRQFVGRSRELRELSGLVGDVGAVVVTAIDGSAGIGKTTLAIEWAHRVKGRFPDGQLYVNMQGFDSGVPMDPGQVLHDFLTALGASPRGLPDTVDAKAALYRSLIADRRVLVVLDNVRAVEQVRPLLPGTPSCLAIITSRNRLSGLEVREGAYRVSLDVLTAEDAHALLAKRISAARLAAEPEAAAELVRLCVRLPLALSLVAARDTGSLGGLVTELTTERGALDALDLGDTDLNLRAVFSWSYKALTPPAARLFRALGVHPGPDIDVHACEALATRQHLRELVTANLITEYVPGRYRFHDLLRAYANECADDDREREQIGRQFLDYYLDRAAVAHLAIRPGRRADLTTEGYADGTPMPAGYGEAMTWFAAEHATLMASISFAADNGFAAHTWRLAAKCTTFLRRTGRCEDRLSVNVLGLRAARESGDRLGDVTALRNVALAASRLGVPGDATGLITRALELVPCLGDLALEVSVLLAATRVYETRGEFHHGVRHAERALELAREAEDDQLLADTLTYMGKEQLRLGRLTEALHSSETAARLYGEGANLEGQADVLINLGDVARALGDHSRAVDCYERSLALDRALGDRYWEAHALDRLGDVHNSLGEKEIAAASWQESLSIFEELGHLDAKAVRSKIGARQLGGGH
jgi:tetratricopeptide (TPR) repeat protein